MIAGLNVKGTTSVTENEASRDHTEKMLESFGANIKIKKEGLTKVIFSTKSSETYGINTIASDFSIRSISLGVFTKALKDK